MKLYLAYYSRNYGWVSLYGNFHPNSYKNVHPRLLMKTRLTDTIRWAEIGRLWIAIT